MTQTTKYPSSGFWRRVCFAGDCWEWYGPRDPLGYGRCTVTIEGTRQQLAHRVSYYFLVGELPEELDHLCRNPACVNPDHLEPVSHRDNTRRGYSPHGLAARQVQCVRGHPYDQQNTMYVRHGNGVQRVCRICRRESLTRYRRSAKNRETQRRYLEAKTIRQGSQGPEPLKEGGR